MTSSKVAVLRTSPEKAFEDYGRAMRMVDYRSYLPPDKDTALKINISWAKFYPACSTTPWQLEAVIRALLEDGYSRDLVHACHNRTVVVNARNGERKNRQKVVVERYGLRNVHLYDQGEEWIRYEPKGQTKVLICHIEASSEPLGQLMNKTEDTLVFTTFGLQWREIETQVITIF